MFSVLFSLFLTTILHWVVVVVVHSTPTSSLIYFFLILSEVGSRSFELRKMLISAEKEEILISQSPVSSMSVPESFESPQPVPLVYTDVTVVPEHERNELEKSISSLEGISWYAPPLTFLNAIFAQSMISIWSRSLKWIWV